MKRLLYLLILVLLLLRSNGKEVSTFKIGNGMDWRDVVRRHDIDMELERWGSVSLVYGVYDITNYTMLNYVGSTHPYPVAFITDRDGKVLYAFENKFPMGTEIEEVIIRDFNDDGLTDICFLLPIDPYALNGRLFYQMEGGEFYEEHVSIE